MNLEENKTFDKSPTVCANMSWFWISDPLRKTNQGESLIKISLFVGLHNFNNTNNFILHYKCKITILLLIAVLISVLKHQTLLLTETDQRFLLHVSEEVFSSQTLVYCETLKAHELLVCKWTQRWTPSQISDLIISGFGVYFGQSCSTGHSKQTRHNST